MEIHFDRKSLKKKGKASFKKHYVIFVMVCLIAAFLGTEFSGSLAFSSFKNVQETAEQIQIDVNGQEKDINVKTSYEGVSWSDVLLTISENDTEAGKELSDEVKQEEIDKSETGNPVLGRTRGVLAGVVNDLSSGSILVTIVSALASITGSANAGIFILILLAMAFSFGFWFLVSNVFGVIMRRMFLEGMNYDDLTTDRLVFLLRIRKWLKASWIMFVEYVYYSLWSVTIVGAVIKRYSYFLVPYIVAENPDMKANEAITLSRKMMNGHKWQCFLLELSFIGWEIIGLFTLGLFNVLYTNPYKMAAFTEYFAELRKQAVSEGMAGTELLKDKYLYEKAEPALIQEKYGDVIAAMQDESEEEHLKGWRGFLANNFGILLMRRKDDRIWERQQAEKVRYKTLFDDVQGLAYPVRLYPIPQEERRMLVQSLNYMRHYTAWSLIAIFLSMSIFGWLWEVSLHLIKSGVFINRGAMHGPWLPIYGSGAVLILTLLYRFRKKPGLEFASTVVVCGVLEYTTSWVMEIVNDGTKWWDYSGYFLNLNGRICAEGLLVFGIGGLAITYVLAPIIDNLVNKINEKVLMVILSALMLIFGADVVYSHFHPNVGQGITDTSLYVLPQQLEKKEDMSIHEI